MQTIVVTTTRQLWEAAQQAGTYAQSTIDSRLDDVGFIHATNPDQTIAMLNRHFTHRSDVLLLLIDVSKVRPEIRFEAPLSGRAGLFPHIYGPLNLNAVYRTIRPDRDAAGNFVESKELTRLAP